MVRGNAYRGQSEGNRIVGRLQNNFWFGKKFTVFYVCDSTAVDFASVWLDPIGFHSIALLGSRLQHHISFVPSSFVITQRTN